MVNSMSDNALMVRVKRGEIEHLGSLFERYHRRLFAFFYRLTQRRDVSEDLVQAVFERIIKYRESFMDTHVFSTWMFTIARNLHTDYHRKTTRDLLNLVDPNVDVMLAESVESQTDTDSDLYKHQVRKALNRLDPDKKQVLILSRFEGLRYKEIADIMECSEGAVKVRVFRALQEMKEHITAIRNMERL